jgi:hypothetical protein
MYQQVVAQLREAYNRGAAECESRKRDGNFYFQSMILRKP